MTMKSLQAAALLVLLTGVALMARAAPGTLLKNEILRATPAANGTKVADLMKGSTVEVLARQGGWTQVRAGKRSGWVRILSVRTQAPTSSVQDIAALTSRRQGSEVVAVAGLRGLNEEQLQTARFNAQGLQELESYRVGQDEAAQFGQAANLASRKLDYLPSPEAPATNTPGGSNELWWQGGQ